MDSNDVKDNLSHDDYTLSHAIAQMNISKTSKLETATFLSAYLLFHKSIRLQYYRYAHRYLITISVLVSRCLYLQ